MLDDLVETRVEAEVAILLDWENWWALEAPGKPSDALRLMPRIRQQYAALFARGTTTDFAHPASDLSHYRLVVAPSLYLIDDAAVANLERFVAEGGTLVVGYFSGIVDPADHIRPGPYPTALRDLLGIHVEEIIPFQATETNRVRTTEGAEFGSDTWAEVIRLEGAEALGTFVDDFYAGGPALTRHRGGSGTRVLRRDRPRSGGIDMAHRAGLRGRRDRRRARDRWRRGAGPIRFRESLALLPQPLVSRGRDRARRAWPRGPDRGRRRWAPSPRPT